ncbi:isochorismate synthase [Bacillus sp. AFS002410]|uniref:isochorismate synthase n=1 Tax=Bacillus sp. AFS002410 TaxID=2033481 RepID=UPI000BF15461|nr:isochorismate synthase [Bacillus sp. AFS002410]PEJ57581.1 isochorismate synthase [Bacillus sp. AFS002410]
MLRTGQLESIAFFEHSLLNAKTCSKRFICKVEKIMNIHPLSVYHFYHELGFTERFYWSNQENSLILTGIGTLVPFHHSTEEQYSAIEKEWKRFGEQVHIEQEHCFGTGPIALGGFSFFDDYKDDQDWKNFGTSHFYIPKLMVTVTKEGTFITSNYEINEQTSVEDLLLQYKEYDDFLENFGMKQPSFTQSECINKDEYEPNEWIQSVKEAIQQMKNEKLEKVVLNRTLDATFSAEVNSTKVIYELEATRNVNYIISYQIKDTVFISATPERLISKKNNTVSSMCLAGSAAKGKTKEENIEASNWLLNSKKNNGEHAFVVNYIRETLKKYCNELLIPSTPRIMATKSLLHLFTPVEGKLYNNVTLFELIQALHPTPALGGFPKEEACKLIRELEPVDRGWYGAPIGWIDLNGNGDFAVGIRSALIKGEKAKLYAGCGVVQDSKPEEEFFETGVKFLPMLNALGGLRNER